MTLWPLASPIASRALVSLISEGFMIAFDLDPAFADFNFSEWWDPALKDGPSASSLYKLVYQARKGDRFAAGKFADAMSWTLRPETWDCLQRVPMPPELAAELRRYPAVLGEDRIFPPKAGAKGERQRVEGSFEVETGSRMFPHCSLD
jgi:hypothetical protein